MKKSQAQIALEEATTNIKRLNATVQELVGANERLSKDLKSATDLRDHYSRANNDSIAQIEQMHALLDVLQGPASRKTDAEESWMRKDVAIMTRLAAYLASRAG